MYLSLFYFSISMSFSLFNISFFRGAKLRTLSHSTKKSFLRMKIHAEEDGVFLIEILGINDRVDYGRHP